MLAGVILAAAVFITGLTMAKYVHQWKSDPALAGAKAFYFTSDLLKEADENARYELYSWGDGITIKLQNFEDAKRFSEADITYEVTADEIENKGVRGLNAVLHFPEEDCQIHEPIPGVHNVYNACAAACVGRIMGLTNEEICEGISHAKTIAGRTNLITVGELLVIDDCYNANPVSMKASLDVLAQADGRKIAVLGDMGELGENECEMHYEVGKYAANQGVDVLFCCGTLSEELAKGAQRGHTQVMYFKTLDKMMLALVPYLRNGDTVLVKASHFMEFSKVVEAICKAWEE